MAKEKEVLVVASKVRAYIKSKKMMTSSEAIPAISENIYRIVDKAAERAKANRRSTIKAQDL
jgi:histone H3/H4